MNNEIRFCVWRINEISVVLKLTTYIILILALPIVSGGINADHIIIKVVTKIRSLSHPSLLSLPRSQALPLCF